ncbi:DMT family transporter [Fusobacteria bacterium ZRK30]|nr:DMT family transporter [Fusobacteria bacterium ZRK30]
MSGKVTLVKKDGFVFSNYSMVLSALFFSGAFIAGKFSVEEFPVFSLTFYRFFIATILLFLILIYRKVELKLPKKEIFRILLLAIFGMTGYQLLFFKALKYTTAINTSLILTITPVMTTIMALFFLKEKISFKSFLGIIISIVGVFFIITNGSIEVIKSLNFNVGDLFMLGAVFFMSINFIILKKSLKTMEPLKLTAYISLFATFLLIPGLIYDNPASYLGSVTIKGWYSLVYMAVFASVFAYLLQQVSIKKIGAINTSLYMNLIPLYSIILSYLILGENISLEKIVAGIIVIAGVIYTVKNKTT